MSRFKSTEATAAAVAATIAGAAPARNAASRRGGRGSFKPHPNNRTSTAQPRPTHFISLRLDHHAALRDKIARFTDVVLASPASAIPGVDRAIFQKPARLHMTLGVMSLVSLEAPQGDQSSQAKASTPKSVEDALVLLRALRPEIQRVLGGAGMISLPLTGLHIMNGNREEAHVMYTGPGDAVDDSPMWKACLLIQDCFKEEGFVTDNRPLKLHCTLANTTFRKPRRPFSFSGIVETVKLYPDSAGISPMNVSTADVEKQADFGTWSVNEVHICKMGSQDKEGRYVSSGFIPLGIDSD